MLTRNTQTSLSRRGFSATLCFLFFFLSSSVGFAQSHEFSKDSIPVVNDEVVFSVKFEYDLKKEEFHRRAYSYLNDKLDPYSGSFITNNEDSTTSKITDYLKISGGAISTHAVYMTYNMYLTYQDGYCNMTIKDITYMEKGYYESQEKSDRKLDMPEYSGKDIMIDEKLRWLFKRNASKNITEATIERINGIIKDLDLAFLAK